MMMLIFLINSLYFLLSSFSFQLVNGGKGETLCNPRNKDIMIPWVIQQWILAHEEVGGSDIKSFLNIFASQGFIWDYSFKTADVIIYASESGGKGNHNQINYARLWKGGHTSITRNLHFKYGAPKDKISAKRYGGTWDEKKQLLLHGRKELEDYYHELLLTNQAEDQAGSPPPPPHHRRRRLQSHPSPSSPHHHHHHQTTTTTVKEVKNILHNEMKLFTFIRNPLEHFESGFTESIASYFHVHRSKGELKREVVDEQMIQGFLNEFLLYGNTSLYGRNHLVRMSTIFFEFDLHLIGHLDHLLDDWNTFIKPAYNLTLDFNLKEGSHPTSIHHPFAKPADPQLARGTLQKFLQENKNYKKAICRILLVDYVCLPEYSLPSDCLHLKTIRNYQMAKLREMNTKISSLQGFFI